MSPRGIVIPAGGDRQVANAYLCLYTIRMVHNSDLPVVLYYNGAAEIHPLLTLIQVRPTCYFMPEFILYACVYTLTLSLSC